MLHPKRVFCTDGVGPHRGDNGRPGKLNSVYEQNINLNHGWGAQQLFELRLGRLCEPVTDGTFLRFVSLDILRQSILPR